MYDNDLLGNPSTNYYGSDYGTLREEHDNDDSDNNSWNRGKTVSMLQDDDDDFDPDSLSNKIYDTCDADNWPGFCLCECDVQCSPPCCTVRRPLRCAGLAFLILSLLEACGIFGISLAIATTEWHQNQTVVPSNSNPNTTLLHHLNPTLVNQACSNSIMAMYASLCFAIFSVQSIRDESKIQLASACVFSVLVVLYVALHLDSDRFGALWRQVRYPALIVSSLCSACVVALSIPVATTFGWVAYKTLRNADPVAQGVFQRFNHWHDAAAMDFAWWVLVVLAGGAFDVGGFTFYLSTTALGTSLVWWRLGDVAVRWQWSHVFTWLYLPLSIGLPGYAGYVAYAFYQDGSIFLAGMTPVHYLVLVGGGVVMRVVLVVVGCKMRYHEDWRLTREVLGMIKEGRQ